MPTSLETVRNKLTARLRTLDAAFERHVVNPSTKMTIDRFALQEGLVSSLWQAWNYFCRETLIGSTTGILNAAGQQVTSQYAGCTEMQAAYIAKELAQGRKINTVKALQGNYLEPTWGDLQKINLIASGIGSSNQSTLLSAFGIGLTVKDAQLCRNASAHISRDSVNQVTAAKVRYSHTKFSHPSDMICWVDPTTKDFAWNTWIEEMLVISQLASA